MRNSFFSKAVVVAASLSVASPVLATDFDAISVNVPTHDLDLGNASDVARLEIRLNRAAHAACDSGSERGLAERRLYDACKASALEGTRVQMQREIALASGGDEMRLASRR